MTQETDVAAPIRVLYAASSAYSGSTLLPFLLNTHPDIAGVGHTQGWDWAADEEFFCSCGKPLAECPFFRSVRDAYERQGLAFDYRDFGTRYELSRNERLNRWLTGNVPVKTFTAAERLRDRLIRLVPPWSRRLELLDRNNRCFMEATLAYHGATVFADGSQDPFRLRHLARIEGLDIHVLHLVRDVRGVVFSNIGKKGWCADTATRMWLDQQTHIVRIAREFGRILTVHYESLCDETDATLKSIHRFVGLEPAGFAGGFKQGDHHVLGNDMRLGDNRIVRSRRWEREMAAADRDTVETICRAFVEARPDHPVADLARHYLDAPLEG